MKLGACAVVHSPPSPSVIYSNCNLEPIYLPTYKVLLLPPSPLILSSRLFHCSCSAVLSLVAAFQESSQTKTTTPTAPFLTFLYKRLVFATMSDSNANAVSAAPGPAAVNGGQAGHGGHGWKNHPDYLDMKEGQYASPDGGNLQTGRWQPYEHRKLANPAPLGLSAFALTTFVLSLINLQTRNVMEPNVVISLAFGYGGLVQLLAGMW